MAQIDPLGWLALIALAAGGLYYRHRSRSTKPSVDDAGTDSKNTGADGEAKRSTDREPSAQRTASESVPVVPNEKLRRLRLVTIRCEHLDHLMVDQQPPTTTLSRKYQGRDLLRMERMGWAGDGYINLCPYHNRHSRLPVELIHVVCDTPDCDERDTIHTEKDTDVEFGRLANDGWCNDSDDAMVCPYCSGFRDRPK